MRVVKFRLWSRLNNRMEPWEDIKKSMLSIVNWPNECHPDNREEFVVMQYIEEKVKNGELYEGDITKSQGKLHEWFWSDRYSGFYYLTVKTLDEDAPFESWEDKEIVGNIYENPELNKKDD